MPNRKKKPALTPYKGKQKRTAKAPVDRQPATSKGVRQVVSLAKLPTLSRTVTVDEAAGEVELCWRLAFNGSVQALDMMRLLYEANGWTFEIVKVAKRDIA